MAIALALLIIEVCIALFVHDRIIRPYIGDVLVVVWLYYVLKSFVAFRPWPAVLAVFLFACLVETAQYGNLVERLGLSHSRFWLIVIGNSFHWADIACYAAGCLLTLVWEYGAWRRRRDLRVR